MSRVQFALLAVGLAALAALPVFAPVLFGYRVVSESGLIHVYFFGAEREIVTALGQIPGWLPQFYSGYPISLTLDGFLNPLFMLALKYLPTLIAFNGLMYVFFIANILSAYALARKLALSKTASVIAAITYGFSGIIMRWTEVIVFTTLFPILPLSFLACIHIKEGRRAWWWVLLGLLTYGWIGGFAELIVYDLVALGPFCLTLLFSDERFPAAVWRSRPWTALLGFLKEGFVKYALPVALSLLVVSPWLISILAYITVSNRANGTLPMNGYDSIPLTLSYVIHLFLPRLNIPYGNNIPYLRIAEDIDLYIGTLPLLLLLILPFVWRSSRQRYRTFFAGLLAFGIIMATDSPIFDLLHKLPVLSWFRWHFKWTFLTVFSAGMLAGFAADLIPSFRTHRFARGFTKILWVLFGIGAAGSLAFTIFRGKIEQVIVSYGTAHYQAVAASSGLVARRSADYYAWIMQTMAHGFVNGFSFRDPWTAAMFALWAIALAAFTVIVFAPGLARRTEHALLIGATLLGSVAAWIGFLGALPSTFLTDEPATAKFLHEQNAYRGVPVYGQSATANIPYRVFAYIPDQVYAETQDRYHVLLIGEAGRALNHDLLEANSSMWFNIDGSFNHEPIANQRIVTIRNAMIGKESATATPSLPEELAWFSSDGTARMLGAQNVKYVLTMTELGSPWKLVHTSFTSPGNIPVSIYENPFFLPRWRFAERVRIVDTDAGARAPDGILPIMQASPGTTVIERLDPGDGLTETPASPSDELNLVEYTAGRLTLTSKTAGARWVVFSETTSPFWRASIDGIATPIRHADLAFQAILVPPGTHTVTFSYAGFFDQTKMSISMLLQ